MSQIENIALATVTDTNYLLGTQILLYSFLRNNPWFKGEIVIIESDLSIEEKKLLQRFPNLRFERPSEILLQRIEILANYWEVIRSKRKNLYSIEAFRFKDHKKLLFLDSDILCIGDMSLLFTQKTPAPILAVSDSLSHKNQIREKRHFTPCPIDQQIDGLEYYNSFNSGCFILNFDNSSNHVYEDLIRLVNPVFFKDNKTRMTDQFLLNQYFHNEVSFIPEHFNYLLNVQPPVNLKSLKTSSDIRIIHYLEYTKPWKTEIKDNSFGDLWREYYNDYLAEYQ